MSDVERENFDPRLEALFRTDAGDEADPAFVRAVMGRIRRRARLRRVVLGAAAVTGIVVSIGPFIEQTMALSMWLSTIAVGWPTLAAPTALPIAALAAAGSVTWIGLSRPLSD